MEGDLFGDLLVNLVRKFESINVKGNLTIWIKQFKNLEEFHLLKEKVEGIGQQS